MSLEFIESKIITVPDYPKKGIMFRDITPLLADKDGLRKTTFEMKKGLEAKGIKPTFITGTESRGFIFGVALADALGLGFVPVRKPGKLPRATYSVSYELEYGSNSLEIHQDAFSKDDVVLVVDDLLATGGTAKATAELIEKTQASVCGMVFVMELDGLGGREKVAGYDVTTLLHF